MLVPDGWDVFLDAAPGVLLIAREPQRDKIHDFRSSLVLTVSPLGDLSFRDWQVKTDQALPNALQDYMLIDLERLIFLGASGGRRLAHHTSAIGQALVLEQWFSVVGGVGYTLSATLENAVYGVVFDILAELAGKAEVSIDASRSGE